MKGIINVFLPDLKANIQILIVLMAAQMGLAAQQTVDLSFQFPPGGPFRKYHIYVPSSYNQQTPARMMLGFHPSNVGTWNGQNWRDTLIPFAEYKKLILLCPDGGADGRIDDSVDYAFTRALIDSAFTWYNIDPAEVFAMGFSAGGKAVYEFGLMHHKLFRGFIPIGAAISDPDWLDDIMGRAKCKNFYLVHGDKDNPNTRYYPVKAKLADKKANVDGTLMAGIGHTFDFPNRDQILYMAFNYIDTASCDYTGIATRQEADFSIGPNPLRSGEALQINWPGHDDAVLEIQDLSGHVIHRQNLRFDQGQASWTGHFPKGGLYILKLKEEGAFRSFGVLVLE